MKKLLTFIAILLVVPAPVMAKSKVIDIDMTGSGTCMLS